MSYDIYFINKAKTHAIKLPIVPTELPAICATISNEVFETYWNGTFSFIEKPGLKTLTLESWLPCKKYNFARSDVMAREVIDLLDSAVNNLEYIQVIIINNVDGSTYLNDNFTIEQGYQYKINRRGDYDYSLPLQQYREAIALNYKLGWNQNSTGWWYCTNVEEYTWYSSSWQYIDGEYYYFNGDGYALSSQWMLWKNVWYYLDDKCKMVHNCWKWIDDKCYYFYDSGAMAHDEYVEGYYVDSSGAWVQ